MYFCIYACSKHTCFLQFFKFSSKCAVSLSLPPSLLDAIKFYRAAPRFVSAVGIRVKVRKKKDSREQESFDVPKMRRNSQFKHALITHTAERIVFFWQKKICFHIMFRHCTHRISHLILIVDDKKHDIQYLCLERVSSYSYTPTFTYTSSCTVHGYNKQVLFPFSEKGAKAALSLHFIFTTYQLGETTKLLFPLARSDECQ